MCRKQNFSMMNSESKHTIKYFGVEYSAIDPVRELILRLNLRLKFKPMLKAKHITVI